LINPTEPRFEYSKRITAGLTWKWTADVRRAPADESNAFATPYKYQETRIAIDRPLTFGADRIDSWSDAEQHVAPVYGIGPCQTVDLHSRRDEKQVAATDCNGREQSLAPPVVP
jgi:hypothetical protein